MNARAQAGTLKRWRIASHVAMPVTPGFCACAARGSARSATPAGCGSGASGEPRPSGSCSTWCTGASTGTKTASLAFCSSFAARWKTKAWPTAVATTTSSSVGETARATKEAPDLPPTVISAPLPTPAAAAPAPAPAPAPSAAAEAGGEEDAVAAAALLGGATCSGYCRDMR